MRLVRCHQAILLGFLVFAGCVTARAESDPHRVARQLREYFLGETTVHGEKLLDDVETPKTSVSEAMRLIGKMREDGSWGDIDYASGDRASWPAFGQITRVLSMVVQARRGDTSPADAAKCIAAAHRAMGYWIEHDFQCPNWWFNEIGVPKVLGHVALLLDNDMTPEERHYILDVALARSKVGTMTGQNRAWLAGIGIMRAAEMNDDALLAQAAAVIRDEIRVTTGEGLQPDWSFQQHGRQEQFGNYGLSYAAEMAQWAAVLGGTRYAVEGDKLAIIRNYLLQGQAWVAWRGAMDISSCGRQLDPGSPREKVASTDGVMRAMALVDPASAGDYEAYVARNRDGAANDLIGNRCFWRSDYIIHRRPEWMASLKMYSTRVVPGECVNSQNLSGAHLEDGATFFYRTGHEYDDIFPDWDWRKIPGVTGWQTDEPIVWPSKAKPLQKTAFVGGVSDGMKGCAAMDFQRDGIRAKKAWFFCGDVVACLGADISSSGSERVVTTINQCLLQGPVRTQHGGKSSASSVISARLDDIEWIEQDGLRYVFPGPQKVNIEAGARTGNWNTVFKTASTPKDDVNKHVFTLWLDHGSGPQGASYAYFVEPTGANDPGVKILSNSAAVQAVSMGDGCIGAVFWSAGSATLNNMTIRVDRPCVLLETSSSDGRQITVADPTEQIRTLRIVIGGRSMELALPQGGDAGKSVSARVP